MKNIISIIGRANVGKSTLFNKLAGKRQAMVSDIPGTTRDLKYSEINWQGNNFELIDTGGFLYNQKTPMRDLTKNEQKKLRKESTDNIDKQVELHARKALKKSNIVFFVVDGKEGLNPQDKEIANYLRQEKKKKIILAVNKCDNPKIRQLTAEFHKLGLGAPILISAANGSGTGDLLDAAIKATGSNKDINEINKDENVIKISIIGKPNVGKSSILNSIIDEEKAIVSDVAHTTREPNDELIKYEDKNILLVDTAGIRRKARVDQMSLESLGIKMSINSLKKSNIALLVLDISQTISHQDLELGKLIAKSGSGAIIVANKYDIIKEAIEKQDGDTKKLTENYSKYIYKHFPHLSWAPIIFTAAKTGVNTKKILKLVLEVDKSNKIKIPDGALSKFLKSSIKRQPPPRKRVGMGSRTKIKRSFITAFRQAEISPPLFECTIGSQEKLPESYRQYLLNGLRTKFGFKGVPIKLVVRFKKEN